jgi:hypothetical protein
VGYALHLSSLNVIQKLKYDFSKRVILDVQIVIERWKLAKLKTSKTRK